MLLPTPGHPLGSVDRRRTRARVAVAVLAVAIVAACGSADAPAGAPSSSPKDTTQLDALAAEPTLPRDPPSTTVAPAPPPAPNDSAIRRADLNAVPIVALCAGAPTPATLDAVVTTPVGPMRVESADLVYGELDDQPGEDAALSLNCHLVADPDGYEPSVAVVVIGPDGAAAQVGGPLPGRVGTVSAGTLVVEHQTGTAPTPEAEPEFTAFTPYVVRAGQVVVGSATAVTGPAPVLRVGGIGPVDIGARYDDIARALGRPVTTHLDYANDQPDDSCRTVTFDGIAGITGEGTGYELWSLWVDGRSLRTATGLGIGSTWTDVLATYGGKATTEIGPAGNRRDVVRNPERAGQVLVFVHDDALETSGAVDVAIGTEAVLGDAACTG